MRLFNFRLRFFFSARSCLYNPRSRRTSFSNSSGIVERGNDDMSYDILSREALVCVLRQKNWLNNQKYTSKERRTKTKIKIEFQLKTVNSKLPKLV